MAVTDKSSTHDELGAPPQSIIESAAEWFVRLHAHDVSLADRGAYVRWLKSSPVHIAEVLRMSRLHDTLSSHKLELAEALDKKVGERA